MYYNELELEIFVNSLSKKYQKSSMSLPAISREWNTAGRKRHKNKNEYTIV